MTANQIIELIQTPEKLNRETLPILKELNERYPAFETGWILYLKNLKNLNDSSFEQELIQVAIRIQDRRKLYLFLNQPSRETELNEPATKQPDAGNNLNVSNLPLPSEYQVEKMFTPEESSDEAIRAIQKKSGKKISLIEKFLEAQPKMPPISETRSGSPMENQSQPEDVTDDLVTETLAMIYSQQGYYKKAIQIFEKLSLKYPEKSTYFAAQIEKIKNLMNN
jgi:tetratricopeptide (TPR) repeat protein